MSHTYVVNMLIWYILYGFCDGNANAAKIDKTIFSLTSFNDWRKLNYLIFCKEFNNLQTS